MTLKIGFGFGNKIFEENGLYIESRYEGKIKKVVLGDEYGPINIYMLPFIKPYDVKGFFEEEIISYDDMMKKVIERENIDISQRNIILTHQFITNSGQMPERTDSEIISIGGLDNIDIKYYKDFDYVAIGHIHRPQKIGRETARYAGTILKYSFSEINHKKTMPIIEFKEKGNLDFTLEELIPLRDMREIKGPIEELTKNENYENTNLEDYIKAIVTNEEPVYDAIGQLRRIYPNVLKLEVKNSKNALSLEEQESNLEKVKNKTELELFKEFYKMQNNIELDEQSENIMKEIIKDETNKVSDE